MQQSPLSILLSSQSNEWYTPSIYVEAARSVMGSIDLDPASCALANETVRATQFYTKEENGLAYPFYGNIWCNPPYGTTNGKSNQGIWTKKIISSYESGQVEQAIILVNSKTDTHWFAPLWQYLICFTFGRINFYTGTSQHRVGNTNGSAFVYLGSNTSRFIEVFRQFGRIVRAIDRDTSLSSLPLVQPSLFSSIA